MRRVHGLVAAVGLSLVVGLYGCSGGGSSEPETSADTGEAPVEEVEEVEPEASANTSVGDFTEIKLPGCTYHWEIDEVSSFAGSKYDVQVQHDAAIGFDDDDNALLIGIDGKPMLDGQTIRGIEYFADGLYMYAADIDDVNNCGLVSLTDGTLIEAEAAKVAYKTDDPADARFLEVIYATEETDNEDECFIFSTDAMFALSPEEGDTMYKGYAKVYDLKNKKFVDGVTIENADLFALKDLGDAFFVEDSDGVYTMYDENGKELWKTDLYPSFGLHSIAFSSNSNYSILDCSAKATFESSDWINQLDSTSDLYTISGEEDKRYAIDTEGNLVLKEAYDQVLSEYNGMFVVSNDEKTLVVDSKGNVLVDDAQEYTVNGEVPGIVTYKNANDKYSLCFSDGRVVETPESYGSDLVLDDGDDNYLVLNDGAFSLKLTSVSAVDKGLAVACANDAMSTYGLYDFFTGKELLDSSYEKISWAGGYIYAFKDGTWSVYETKLVQD